MAQVTRKLEGVCRSVGLEIPLSTVCSWKEQEIREKEWCLRPGPICE